MTEEKTSNLEFVKKFAAVILIACAFTFDNMINPSNYILEILTGVPKWFLIFTFFKWKKFMN